jgi:PAS domain S-box-containing protein
LDPVTRIFKRYPPKPEAPDNLSTPHHVNALAEDPQHRLWIATMGGLYRYNPSAGGFTVYKHDPKNPHSVNANYVTSLLSTRSGEFWIGTQNGIARWDSATDGWIRFEHQPGNKNSLSQNYVLDLLEDHHGSIWVATYGGGLNKLDPRKGEFQWLRASDGMPSDLILGLLEDLQGILWISTNNGIARIDPETLKIRTYDESNGLQGRQFYPRARLRLRSGELLFGGTQGFSRINPSAIEVDQTPPPVVFTQFEVLNQPVHPALPGSLLPQSITETSRLEISSRTNVVSFQFVALNFRSPTYNHYLYRLDGFDPVWRSAGLERRATYTNLAPGRYRLRVKAANRDNVWNETGASLEVVILPTWWQSWWFQGSLALCLLGALVATVWMMALRQSQEQLREAEREKQLAQERQRAAETLMDSEYRYRQLVENTTDGISVVQDGFIRTLNARFALMIGYQLEEVIDQSLFQFIHPEDCTMLADHFHKQIQGDSELPAIHEFRLIPKEDKPLWFELNTTKIQWEARPATLNIFRDTTIRKKAEEEKLKLERQLLQAQKLESLGVLAGGIAHDFNNILSAIGGYTELVLENEATQTDENREFLLQVLKASNRAKDLVKQILTISRRSDQEFRPARVDLIVKEALKFLRASIPATIEIEFFCEPTEFLVVADATQIHQIIMNLVSNSAYAMQEKGGKLEVGLSRMEFTSEWHHESERILPAGAYARLLVRDDGPGIPPEIFHKIFDPFLTTKPQGEGTGLGLSIVHGIVQNHKGTIRVNSTPGEGTVFEVFLPLIESADTTTGQERLPVQYRGQGEWILVVDDEAELIALEKRMLEQLGYHVMAETNSRVALDLFQGQSTLYRAVLADLTMPNLTGLELAAEILKIRPETPVILCTGSSDSQLEEKVRGRGIRKILRKPFSTQELRETLARLIHPANSSPSDRLSEG